MKNRLLDGPPYASGRIHYGTILNKYLKTLYWRITEKGSFPFYFDTHGLPIENTLPKNSDWKELLEKAQDNTEKMLSDFKKYRLVPSTHLSTYEEQYGRFMWSSFKELFDSGKIYRKKRVTSFCPKCQSVCSNNEIEYKKCEALLVFFVFHTTENEKALVATTQPWTLYSNQGIGFNSNLKYFIDKKTKIIASERYWNSVEDKTLVLFDLNGKEYTDINGQTKKFISSNEITDSYTGLVHLSPQNGEFDFSLVDPTEQKENINIKGESAEGISYLTLNKTVLSHPNTIKFKQIIHKDGVCWRCETPCLRKLMNNTYLKVVDKKQKILEKIEKKEIQWSPLKYEKYFSNWIKGIQDWCISRQRKWGVSIPLWENNKKYISVTPEQYLNITGETTPLINVFHNKLLPLTINNQIYTPVNEIFDVWIDSGLLSVFDTLKQKEKTYLAAIESHDQIRGWFYGSIILRELLDLPVPFSTIYVHGYLLSSKNKKLSKRDQLEQISNVSSFEVDQILLYLSSRSPWENLILDLSQMNKSNKALSIVANLEKVVLNSHGNGEIGKKELLLKLNLLIKQIGLITEDFSKITSLPLINFIIFFSREYVNKNKGNIDRELFTNIFSVIKLLVNFFLLKQEKSLKEIYLEIKKRE